MATTQEAYSNLDLRAEHPAARRPDLLFAFEFPALLHAFEAADALAIRHKGRARAIGMAAVFLVLVALLIAASGPLLGAEQDRHRRLIGLAAAGVGILGTLLGLAAYLPRSDRRLWLFNRLKAENLRLFHFSFLTARFPEVIASGNDPACHRAYVVKRATAFADVERALARLTPGTAHAASLHSEADVCAGINIPEAAVVESALSGAADHAFTAWREIRLRRQLSYCDAKLQPGMRLAPSNPLWQERFFSLAGWSGIFAVILLHLLNLVSSPMTPPAAWLEVGVVWVAMGTLALRALEDGLQSEREVERYEQYRANVEVALERFDATTSMAAKIETIRAFERRSTEEMQIFLRTHAKSHFLL